MRIVAVAGVLLLGVAGLAGCGGGDKPVASASPAVTPSPTSTSDPSWVTARIKLGAMPCGVVSDATAVWVSLFGDNTLDRIDPKTNTVTDTLKVGKSPC